MVKKIFILPLMLSTLISQVFATSVNSNLQTTANLVSTCSLAVNNMSFGNMTPSITGVISATSVVNAICSNGVTYTLSLNAGNGTISNRIMKGVSQGSFENLAYNIYTDSGYTTIFGDGTTGSTISLVGTGSTQATTIYGNLSLNQYLTPDFYTDNLTITLNY